MLSEFAHEGLIVVDRDWVVVFCSPEAQALLGISEQALGMSLWRCLPEASAAAARSRVRRALAAGRSTETAFALPGGTWAHVKFVPCPTGATILLRDATREIRSEWASQGRQQRLARLNASLKLAHRAARGATWEWMRGRPLRWTDLETARALPALPAAWTEASAIVDWVGDVVAEDRGEIHSQFQQLLEVGHGRAVFRVRGADGAIHWLESNCIVAERDAHGAPVRLAGITTDITERKTQEAALRREIVERQLAEDRQRLLVLELNHRVKNTLATVQSMARQTLGRTPAARAVYEEFEARLLALSWTHDVLTAEGWGGAWLAELIEMTLRPHAGDPGSLRVEAGPPVWLSPQQTLSISMALHELATNALKYGALRQPSGEVLVRWALEPHESSDLIVLQWRERGGPPVQPPQRAGFGSRLLRAVAAELGHPVDQEFAPSGVVCTLRLEPIARPRRPDPADPAPRAD